MPLAQVASIVDAPADRRSEALIAYWEAVERRIAGQREALMNLLIALAGKERSFDMFEVQERAIPEQIVLTEQRHVTVDVLPGWMGEAFGRMWELAPRFGGITGPVMAIFHGQVSADSDGPVEICAPIRGDQPIAPNVPTRVEPAHHEAYTRLHKGAGSIPGDPVGLRRRRAVGRAQRPDHLRPTARGVLHRFHERGSRRRGS